MIGACPYGRDAETTVGEIVGELPAEEPLDGPWAPPHLENGVARRINSVVGRGPDVECRVNELATFSTGFTVLLGLLWRPGEATRREVAGLLRQSPLSRAELPFADWWVQVELDSGDIDTLSLRSLSEVEQLEEDAGDAESHTLGERTLIYAQSVETSTMGNVGEISISWLIWVPRLTSAVTITSGWEAGGLPLNRLKVALDQG